jgi:hypothetical protein
MSGVAVRAIGLLTGWGPGVAALPPDARQAAEGRGVIALSPVPRTSDRLRRATRECLLAVDAVDALLADGDLARSDLAGAGTALVYVTAAAYGASNRAFVEGGGGALHFPYTAPSAVPAEVAIEFGLHGPYAVLIGGAAATIDAIAHASALLARGACERAIVLAVETFTECADLLSRSGVAGDSPLVEAACAVLLVGRSLIGIGGTRDAPPKPPSGDDAWGETLSCSPLIALARARASSVGQVEISGRWRGRETTTTVGVAS